ncbi:receptor-like protein kinase FERONIA [Quercus suber]|uniref:receptor-like protein kinase FERONIA n=1 Tax=Quercus suber TaxID=58331 RepID=UPI000CE22270|nr:receptor-like protein kinase FERONIA [Quercus suber]POF09272.1 receptor-like protein kinase feronia [Quercus suber]
MEGISQSISKLLRRSGKGRSDEKKQYYSSVLPEGLCRRFSLAEIKKATNYFAYDLVIGEGGFGKVYKGFIDDRGISVAIKRLNIKSSSGQGCRELTNEVLLLCQIRHPNLIPLIGYCIDEGEGCLVYEFMVNGNLHQHICGTNHDPLPWKQRLAICIGVARGLHYLHTGLKHTIIHRGGKMSDILLDEKWEAKLADFGLSKMGPPSLSKALIRVESVVKGTMGYLDPEYLRSEELTDKSDVYAFGVVLFELLCGRKALDHNLEEEQFHLISWASKCKQEGTINEIIDPYLMGKIAPECFKIYIGIASSCVREEGKDRPAMGEVEVGLEHALQLQESADAAREEGEYDYPINELTCSDSPIENEMY